MNSSSTKQNVLSIGCRGGIRWDPRGTGAPTLKEKKKKIYIYIYISILYLGPPFKTFENFPYNFTLISM